MDFIVNCLLFPVVKEFENRLRFDEVTAKSLVAPFLGHGVDLYYCLYLYKSIFILRSAP